MIDDFFMCLYIFPTSSDVPKDRWVSCWLKCITLFVVLVLEGYWDLKSYTFYLFLTQICCSGAKCVSLAFEQRNVENVLYAPIKRYNYPAIHIKHSKSLDVADYKMHTVHSIISFITMEY